MRFTRQIPGIRLPLPGRRDEAPDGFTPWSSSYLVACAYIFLVVPVLGIYLECVLRLDGGTGVFWLEPQGAGLSILGLITVTNVLLVAFLALTFFLSGRWRGQLGRQRAVGLLFVLGTLGAFQYWARCEGRFAEDVVNHVLTRKAELQGKVEGIEREIEALGEHIWAGKYTGLGFGGEVTCWFAPQAGYLGLGTRAGSSDEDHPARRAYDSYCGEAELLFEDGDLQLGYRYGDQLYPGVKYVHEWSGDRHFLVRSDCLGIFREQAEKGEIVGRPTLIFPHILRHVPE